MTHLRARDRRQGGWIHRSLLVALLFATIAVLAGLDMSGDVAAGVPAGHLVVETAMVVLALVGLLLLWVRAREAEREAVRLEGELEVAEADAQRLRSHNQQVARGVGESIERQFEGWRLTPSESAIGLLLLKGLSLKEAAEVRGTSERTVRQQSLGLYRKAGVKGRAELSAFFLEDLLAPAPQASDPGHRVPPARTRSRRAATPRPAVPRR